MSFAHARSSSAAGASIFPGPSLAQPERRRSSRYRFTAETQCILAANRIPAKIQDIGSGGVFLKTDGILRLGESIQVLIDWPVLLDQRCPLRLVIFGKVLRSDESGSAVKLVQYEFRIRPKGRLGDVSKKAEQLFAQNLVDSNPNDGPTALILDGDLGFALALSHELSNRHVAAFPVRTASEARSMLTRFRLRPDVLVIGCSYPGACSFAERIAKDYPELKIIAIVSTRYQCKNCADQLAVTLRDPDDTAPVRIPHCAEVVWGVLKNRIRFIRNAGET